MSKGQHYKRTIDKTVKCAACNKSLGKRTFRISASGLANLDDLPEGWGSSGSWDRETLVFHCPRCIKRDLARRKYKSYHYEGQKC